MSADPERQVQIAFVCCANCGLSFLFQTRKPDALIEFCPGCDDHWHQTGAYDSLIAQHRSAVAEIIQSCLGDEPERMSHQDIALALCDALANLPLGSAPSHGAINE